MGTDGKRLRKIRKKWILVAVILTAAVAAGCGVWYYMGHTSSEPVYVYPFQMIGMTEYWGDSQESHGPVTTDKVQTVFLSDTQTVTEILVQPGDAVKKGDLLMTFDTTLSDLQLERKRLDVEKLKLQLESAEKELKKINAMKPMEIPTYEETVEEDPDLGIHLGSSYQIFASRSYDGSSAQKAAICWIPGNREIDNEVFQNIQKEVSYYQDLNAPEDVPEESTDPEEDPGEDPEDDVQQPVSPISEEDDSAEATQHTEETTESPEEATQSSEPVQPLEPSSASAYDYPLARSFHVVFKVTSGNMSLGDKTVWQGMQLTETGNGFTFRFENALIPDHSVADMGGESDFVETPQIDMGSGYTAAQIAQMRSEQQKKIKDLEFQIKMADAEYRIMQTEVDDGNVYATIDGEVVSCLTEEEAKATRQPILKLSGGGGFYVEGFISELEKDNMQIGQEVTVNDWNTGMVYTGTIQSIGDFPSQQSYFSGNGNPNASNYPFRVFVDGEADLQSGSYVSVVYSAAESENGIYLENPFLRKEQGRAYVLVLGRDGKLEQRFVTTGKSLWGNYTQILSGLTAEDLIAFPYGKNVKPGAPAVEGDLSKLYG